MHIDKWGTRAYRYPTAIAGAADEGDDVIKLSQLRHVLAVSEMGSLRAAGRHLGIAQPAITRSIRDLEQELGAILFERHAKGVRLTEIGKAFLARAHAVQAELVRAKDEVEQLKGRLSGKVSMALSTASSMALLPAALAEFRKRYPDAMLKISETFFAPIERELLDGRTDFYVGPFEAGSTANSFIVELLFDNQRRVVARRGIRWRGFRPSPNWPMRSGSARRPPSAAPKATSRIL